MRSRYVELQSDALKISPAPEDYLWDMDGRFYVHAYLRAWALEAQIGTFLREKFGPEVQNHFTYAIVSDGDLMEGIAAEAASLAGQLGLGRLVYLYDDNDISLDGPTSLSFDREDVDKRFEAYYRPAAELIGRLVSGRNERIESEMVKLLIGPFDAANLGSAQGRLEAAGIASFPR